jgi:hypothetical protein
MRFFLSGNPDLDCTFAVPHRSRQKKRYVYMVQSGIMNYNGCAAGAKAMVKEEIFPFIDTIRLVERVAKMIGEAK